MKGTTHRALRSWTAPRCTLRPAFTGQHGEQAQRHRPWYTQKESPTFADMLAACRLQLWQEWFRAESGVEVVREASLAWLLEYVATST